MGSFVSYPKFVSPATKTLHPDAVGTDLTLRGGLAVGNNENPLDGQIKLGSAAGSGYLTFYDGSYRDGYIDAANLYLQINGVTKTTIGANGIAAGSFAPGAIVNADVSTSAAITLNKINVPRFVGYLSSTLSNVTGDSTSYGIGFNAAVSGYADGFNTSNGIFTAPSTGAWQFSALVALLDVTSSHTLCDVVILTSNRTYRLTRHDIGSIRDSVGGLDVYGGSVLADMDAGDTAYIQVTVHGSTKTVDVSGGTNASFFTGHQVSRS